MVLSEVVVVAVEAVLAMEEEVLEHHEGEDTGVEVVFEDEGEDMHHTES